MYHGPDFTAPSNLPYSKTEIKPSKPTASFSVYFEGTDRAKIKLDPSAFKDFIGKKCSIHLTNGVSQCTNDDSPAVLVTSTLRTTNQSYYQYIVIGLNSVEKQSTVGIIGNLLFHTSKTMDKIVGTYRAYPTPYYEAILEREFDIVLQTGQMAAFTADGSFTFLVFDVELIE